MTGLSIKVIYMRTDGKTPDPTTYWINESSEKVAVQRLVDYHGISDELVEVIEVLSDAQLKTESLAKGQWVEVEI